MLTSKAIKAKLEKQWQQFKFHKAYLNHQAQFPLQVKLQRINDKHLLHHFAEVQQWIASLEKDFRQQLGIKLIKQEVNYAKMGRQLMPLAIEFNEFKSLAKYLGHWQEWQKFIVVTKKILTTFPELRCWLQENPMLVNKYLSLWDKLLTVCQFFQQHSQPNCYIRELAIAHVDSKFIESHKAIIRILLDQLLPEQAINSQYTKLIEHGFEKRFGLCYEQPLIRFRCLDPSLSAEFGGVSDISIPIDQFNQLDLLLDRVFITENKVNGLAFPLIKNALVIFGLGYGIQLLKNVDWLNDCRIHYWGDIDTHGFAILSQLRGYFPKVESLLMDQDTLLACKELWGEEPENKAHPSDVLAHLTVAEQTLYQRLKTAYWQPKLRLEQERIAFSLLAEKLRTLK